MKTKYLVILSIVITLLGSAPGFTQVLKTEQEKKIDELIRSLTAPDNQNWNEAAEALVKIGELAIESLFKVLRDKELHFVDLRKAVWILRDIGTEKAVGQLIEAMNNEELNINIRIAAASALGEIKSEKAIEALILTVKDKNSSVRVNAINTLGAIGTDEIVNVLIEALKDKDSIVRGRTAFALGKIKSEKVIDPLFKAIEDTVGYVRGMAVNALGGIKSEKVIVPLVMALKDEDWTIRREAAGFIAEFGEPAVVPLINLLKDNDSHTRWEAASVLGKIRSEKAVKAFVDALKDDDRMVRYEAAAALGKIKSEKAVEPLIEVLQDKVAYVREEAAWVLGEIKSEKAVETLIQALDDKESGWMAALALGKIGPEEAVEPLVMMLKSENIKHRRAVTWALEKIPSEKAVKPLIESLKDEDREVRLWSVKALEKIGTPEALKAVERYKKQISHNQEIYDLYPEILDMLPDIPSPFTAKDGKEIVVGFTKNEKFALVLVTVENGATYFINGNFGKGKQLEVDAEDFPTLAETGLHSEIELDQTRTITDKSISEITYLGRPERSSGAGFMGNDEDIISVLKGDNRLVEKMGLTHPQTAKPLFHVWNLILKDYELGNISGQYGSNFKYTLYNGKKILVEAHGTRGFQESIFDDEIRGNFQMNIRRELDGHEKEFLNKKYSNLKPEQMEELVKKLSYFHTGEMVPYYVMRYGFYEGHTDYRADPIAIAFIFGLKSLEEIESVFNGNLYEVLTTHFTSK